MKKMLRFGTRFVAFNMRAIRIIVMLISPMFLYISCERLDKNHYGYWYAKNCTNQTLILDYPFSKNIQYSREVAQGDSIRIGRVAFQVEDNMPYFDRLVQFWNYTGVEDMSLKILSKDSVLLKTWNYSDREMVAYVNVG